MSRGARLIAGGQAVASLAPGYYMAPTVLEDAAPGDEISQQELFGPVTCLYRVNGFDEAVHLGFPRHIAHDLVIETLEGSTLFAKASGLHPAQLRNMVTSPGGTSAAALHELESGRLRTVLSEAVWAAFRRTVELGDQLEASVGAADERPSRRRAADPSDDGGADPA